MRSTCYRYLRSSILVIALLLGLASGGSSQSFSSQQGEIAGDAREPVPELPVPPAPTDTMSLPVRSGVRSVTLVNENDSWITTDRYYTNGLRIAANNIVSGSAAVAVRDAILFPMRSAARAELKPSLGFALGQNMYTPQDISTASPSPLDRPYGGWLYGGVILELRDGGHPIDHHMLELDLGLVGNASLAGAVQTWWHTKVVGAPRPNGWPHQIANAFGYLVHYRGRSKLVDLPAGAGRSWADLSQSIGGSLGNIAIGANVGTMARIGYFESEGFGPSGAIESWVAPERRERPLCEAYLFFGVEGRYVLRNIMLDREGEGMIGPVGHDPLVGQAEVGLHLRVCALSITARYMERGREFPTQRGTQKFLHVALGVSGVTE